MTIDAIDLSSNNDWRSVDTAGASLCIVKLTEGLGYHWNADPEVIAWARTWAKWVMGYHWIDPAVPAVAQSSFFASVYEEYALDGWWLDVEDPHAPAVPWATLVPSVFDLVAAQLGASRGGCYKGRYFVPELNGYCAAHNWWDPDYRGHPDFSGGVLLAQYTSTGGPGGAPLDRSRVLDEPRFLAMVGAPAPVQHWENNVYLCHRPANSAEGHGTGYQVTDRGKSQIASAADYASLRDKGHVSDAGQLDDATIDALPDAR